MRLDFYQCGFKQMRWLPFIEYYYETSEFGWLFWMLVVTHDE